MFFSSSQYLKRDQTNNGKERPWQQDLTSGREAPIPSPWAHKTTDYEWRIEEISHCPSTSSSSSPAVAATLIQKAGQKKGVLSDPIVSESAIIRVYIYICTQILYTYIYINHRSFGPNKIAPCLSIGLRSGENYKGQTAKGTNPNAKPRHPARCHEVKGHPEQRTCPEKVLL